jgi:hypothetical protein
VSWIAWRKGIGSRRHLAAPETSQFLLVGEIAHLLILSCDVEIGGTKDRGKMASRWESFKKTNLIVIDSSGENFFV